MISEVTSVLITVDAKFVDSALQATMFADSALQATMFSAATSTLSSANRGEGIKTGDNKGEFVATSNYTLSSTLLFDCGLVRTKSFPQLKYLLLSFKERLLRPPEESRLYLVKLAILMLQISPFEHMRVGKMFERGIVRRGWCILSSNLNVNLKSHILRTSGYKEFESIFNILV